MYVLKPIDFSSAQLISSTAQDADPIWSSGTVYALGAKVSYLGRIWTSLQASNSNRQPDTSPTWWTDGGATNRLAMFDNVVATSTRAVTSLTVVYKPGAVFDAVGFITVDAAVIKITVRDGIGGPIVYQGTAGLSGSNVTSWYDYFFADPLMKRTQVVFSQIPPYVNGVITIELQTSTGSSVSLSQLVAGSLSKLGSARYGATAGIIDYSVKSTDAFGVATFVKRAFSKRLNCSFVIDNTGLNRVQSYLYSIRATPVVWIAAMDTKFEEALIVYGFYKDFTTEIAYPSFSQCSIEIEGLA